jgi:cytochrome c553
MTSIRDRRAAVLRLAVSHPWLAAAALLLGVVAIAAVTVISGIAPIGASSGHWRITAAILDFAKVRSVSTHAWGIDVPPLEDEALVLRGAGHYEAACLPCHGGPGRRMLAVMAAMTPHPPDLRDQLSRWRAEELFSIVKHGIKFTGMPAWPAQQRDDEVWSMVAFLRRMPKLDASSYRNLAYGDPSTHSGSVSLPAAGLPPPPIAVRQVCWRCHGVDGTGRGDGAFPSLAGQRAEYLEAALRAFADRQRFSGTMSGVAANLNDDDMRAAAAYYSALPPRGPERSDDPTSIGRGAAMASRGLPERDIPACIECHGPIDGPRNPAYPQLVGQHRRYLAQQLRLMQERHRGGSMNVTLMEVFVGRLRPDEIADVTRYYASGARR